MDETRSLQLAGNWRAGALAARSGDGPGADPNVWRAAMDQIADQDPAMRAAFERGVAFGLAAWPALDHIARTQVADLDDP